MQILNLHDFKNCYEVYLTDFNNKIEFLQHLNGMSRKLLKFLILFDNTSLLYFPGQFLSGRVLLELQDETPALGEFLINTSMFRDEPIRNCAENSWRKDKITVFFVFLT